MAKVKVLFISLSSFPVVLISPVVSFTVKGRPKNEYRNKLSLLPQNQATYVNNKLRNK